MFENGNFTSFKDQHITIRFQNRSNFNHAVRISVVFITTNPENCLTIMTKQKVVMFFAELVSFKIVL